MIPAIAHFVLPEPGGSEQDILFAHYIAIKSFRHHHPRFEIRVHATSEPSGMYWTAAKRHATYFEWLSADTSNRSSDLHRRLTLLLAHGGISLVLDSVTVGSFETLLHHSAVLGSVLDGTGLAVASDHLVLAEPGAAWVRVWLRVLETTASSTSGNQLAAVAASMASDTEKFDPVLLPAVPAPTAEALANLFFDDITLPSGLAQPLWEAFSGPVLRQIDERNSVSVDSSYNRLARQYLTGDVEWFVESRRAELTRLLAPPMRVNLGCGANRRRGWLNVDAYSAASPDLVFDLTVAPWPLPDNSVGEVELSHVLEHLGDRFEIAIKELYRVCMPNARVRIKIPHPRHDWFLADPTHTRALLPLSFTMLDAQWCRQGLLSGQTATPLAVYWKVDFETISAELEPSQDALRLNKWLILAVLGYPIVRHAREALAHAVKRLFGTPVESTSLGSRRLAYLSRISGNMIAQIQVELRVRKSFRN